MADWMVAILRDYGLAGLFIFVLIVANGAQWVAGKAKDSTIAKLHEQRAAERETLVTLLERANVAQTTTSAVTAQRNEVIDRLSGAILAQTHSNDRVGERVAAQSDMTKDKLGDIRHVIDATGESYRVLNGLVAEIRNILMQLCGKVDAVAVDVKVGNSA